MGFSFEGLTFSIQYEGGIYRMKYCPYCGTVLVDGAVSFCAECGKALPVSEKKDEIQEKSNQSEQQSESKPQQEIKHEEKSRSRHKSKPLSEGKVKGKEVDKAGERQIKLSEPAQSPKRQSESPAVRSSMPEDDYDGYYDDILPADEGRFSEGIDRELVKKIALIIGVVFLIVGACVMMMYLL